MCRTETLVLTRWKAQEMGNLGIAMRNIHLKIHDVQNLDPGTAFQWILWVCCNLLTYSKHYIVSIYILSFLACRIRWAVGNI